MSNSPLKFHDVLGWIALSTYFVLNGGSLVVDVQDQNNSSFNHTQLEINDSQCQEFGSFEILNNGHAFVEYYNASFEPSFFEVKGPKLILCLPEGWSHTLKCRIFYYDSTEYTMLPNKTVILYGEIIEPGNYEIVDDEIKICDSDDTSGTSTTPNKDDYNKALYVYSSHSTASNVLSGFSLAAMAIHLIAFAVLPILRNLPGYNLASLTVALTFAYTFRLIAQIPQVVGKDCAAVGFLEKYFFLSAFLWMNVIAFDVFKSLKEATEKLRVRSRTTKFKRFGWYSLYAWGVPFIIMLITLILDNLKSVPDKYKPFYGKDELCDIANPFAMKIFLTIPSVTIFTINAILFSCSVYIIAKNNTMKNDDEQQKNATQDFVLYFRLSILIGITWLFSIFGAMTENEVVWSIFEVLNVLQGIYIFVLFTCTKKVLKQIRRRFKGDVLTQESNATNYSSCSMATELK